MSGFFGCNVSNIEPLQQTPPVQFVVQPSRNLICLLCQQVFEDPVISECGHTFCRRCISFNQSARCPLHPDKHLIVVVDNLTVHEQIDELLVKCKYGLRYSNEQRAWVNNEDGCPAVIKVLEKSNHESQCEFRLVRCPNCDDGPLIKQKDLEAHLNGCQQLRCSCYQYGCQFLGSAAQLNVHQTTECKFEPFKDFLRSTDEKLQEQNESLSRKDQEIGFLRSVITKLSERVDVLDQKFESLQECSARAELDIVDLRRDLTELTDDLNVSKCADIVSKPDSNFLKCIGTFVGHEGPVWCLAGYRDFLYTGSSDATIKVWDVVNSYECVRTLEGHEGIILSLAIYDNKLYSGSSDCCFNVWSLDTYSVVRRVQAHDQAVCTMVTWNALLLTGSLKSIKIWDMNNNCTLLTELPNLNHWIRALLVSQNLLYSGSYQAVIIWDLESYNCIKTITTTGGNVYGLCIYDSLLYCGVSENVINVIDLSLAKTTNTLKGHEGTVYSVAVLDGQSKSEPLLLSSSYDKSIRVWSLKTSACLQTQTRHQGSVSCLLVHNNRVFSGSVDSCIKVWC